MYIGLADGFCRAGKTGGSYLIYNLPNTDYFDYKNKTVFVTLNDKNPIVKKQMYLHPKESRTSNNAEARTLCDLLERLNSEQILHPNNRVLVLTDSQVVQRLVIGSYKCHSPALKDIINQIMQVGQHYRMLYNQPISTTLRVEHIPGDLQKVGPIGH